ncbi:hypothetical protein SAMN04487970_1002136 [Paenibacillus tianmuensis]|uniref:Uncharacterized protein n=1 Tax=Paenibacillus tianmuensis TaxID=624147 RepID=A0A1G4PFR8_9BACL|nr:hypothetical protein SAMN04487970_1002136 [Paenibacillus tianmuensis]
MKNVKTKPRLSSSFKRFIMTIMFLALAVSLAACGAPKESAASGKVKKTATIGMITDIVKHGKARAHWSPAFSYTRLNACCDSAANASAVSAGGCGVKISCATTPV